MKTPTSLSDDNIMKVTGQCRKYNLNPMLEMFNVMPAAGRNTQLTVVPMSLLKSLSRTGQASVLHVSTFADDVWDLHLGLLA